MKPVVRIPRSVAEKKPPHGAPCNRCGACCLASLCPLATIVFGDRPGPCPALEWTDGLARCGLVHNPQNHAIARTLAVGVKAMGEAAALLIGSGTGCDARFNGEPINHAFHAQLIAWDRANAKAVRRAKRVWNAPI